MQPSQPDRHLLARYVGVLAAAKGDLTSALHIVDGQGQWLNQRSVAHAVKGAIEAMASGDLPVSTPIGEAFLASMAPVSIVLQLAPFMKNVPMRTQVYVGTGGVSAARLAEGGAIPLASGTWAVVTLTPGKHGGAVVQTLELFQSMSNVAAQGLTGDLVAAVAQAEDRSFISPEVPGSVLYGASTFSASGSDLASVGADLKQLLGLVDASRRGACFAMESATATAISLLRGTGGAPAFPNIGPQGGELLGLPVHVTTACAIEGSPPTRIVGLIDPSSVLYADEQRVAVTASTVATLQQDDAPTSDALTGTGTTQVSMFQTNSVAIKAVRESAWYARPGSGAYFTAGY